MEERKILTYWELTEEWQKEAKSNLEEFAEDQLYLEPLEGQTPEKHILWSLEEVTHIEGEHDGFKYNATMTISNNSGMLLNIDYDAEMAKIKFV